MKKAHRIALRPTSEQESVFGQHAGYVRFAYNWAVGEFKAGLDVGEWLSERTLRPRWNQVKGMIAPWGTDLSQNGAKYAVIDFSQAALRTMAGFELPGVRTWRPCQTGHAGGGR